MMAMQSPLRSWVSGRGAEKYEQALRTHVLSLLGPKTILRGASGLS